MAQYWNEGVWTGTSFVYLVLKCSSIVTSCGMMGHAYVLLHERLEFNNLLKIFLSCSLHTNA